MMRFLTREWATGGLIDEEWEERFASYRRRSHELRELLADGAELLLDDVNLHDAQSQSFTVDEHEIGWRLLAGDLQRGYEWVELRYREAVLADASPEEVQAWLGSPGCEVLYDEIDLVGSTYEHRLLLDPEGEFSIRFSEVRVVAAPATPEDRR